MALRKVLFTYFLCALAFKLSSSLSFTSCGGDDIEALEIEGCESDLTCTLKRGHSYDVYLLPLSIHPPLVEPNVRVGLVQIGAFFEQESGCINQCVSYLMENSVSLIPRVEINVTIAENVLTMSSTLRINTTFVDTHAQAGGFCVETPVTVTSS